MTFSALCLLLRLLPSVHLWPADSVANIAWNENQYVLPESSECMCGEAPLCHTSGLPSAGSWVVISGEMRRNCVIWDGKYTHSHSPYCPGSYQLSPVLTKLLHPLISSLCLLSRPLSIPQHPLHYYSLHIWSAGSDPSSLGSLLTSVFLLLSLKGLGFVCFVLSYRTYEMINTHHIQ